MHPSIECHAEFVRRLSLRAEPSVNVFNLNYDPLIERAADFAKVRITDGFLGMESAYFHPPVFEERIGRIRGSYRALQFEEVAKPIHLFKLHGSVGWTE